MLNGRKRGTKSRKIFWAKKRLRECTDACQWEQGGAEEMGAKTLFLRPTLRGEQETFLPDIKRALDIEVSEGLEKVIRT